MEEIETQDEDVELGEAQPATIEDIRRFCRIFVKKSTRRNFVKEAPDPEKASAAWSRIRDRIITKVKPILEEFSQFKDDMIPMEHEILLKKLKTAFFPIWIKIRREYELEERILDFQEKQREELGYDGIEETDDPEMSDDEL